MHKLFKGCPYDDILEHIDKGLDMSPKNRENWYINSIGEEKIQYSFFEELANGWICMRSRLLEYLSTSDKYFTKEGKPKTSVYKSIQVLYFSH